MSNLQAAIRQAMTRVRASDPREATHILLQALRHRECATNPAAATGEVLSLYGSSNTAFAIDPNAECIGAEDQRPFDPGPAAFRNPVGIPDATRPARVRRGLADVISSLRTGKLKLSSETPKARPRRDRPISAPIATNAQFLARSITCGSSAFHFKLYVPSSSKPRGLIVMLHGCQQNPDDFALGTNMNAIAEAHGLLVAYPAQSSSSNMQNCWNWFNPADQVRDKGEPSFIAGMTRLLVSEYGIEQNRVCIAGLSAGGAMAVVMATAYPELFATVAVHSGLPYGSANDVVSAFAAMRGDSGYAFKAKAGQQDFLRSPPRMILFHGTDDRTVHPVNAARLITTAETRLPPGHARHDKRISVGKRWVQHMALRSPEGIAAVESWMIEGCGHQWSGGNPDGSYTDALGPDASSEIVRFLLQRPATSGE